MNYTAVVLILSFLLLFLLLGKNFLRKSFVWKNKNADWKHQSSAADDSSCTDTQLHGADLKLLGNPGYSCRGVSVSASARVAHLFSTWLKRDPLVQGMLCFFLLGFRDISLFLVGGCHNLISLAPTVQCSKLPALSWPTILEQATSGSAFLQLCKTLLSFRYSSQGTTPKEQEWWKHDRALPYQHCSSSFCCTLTCT